MLSRDKVLVALQRVSELLAAKDVVGEIDIVGGAAMMLAFQARQSTKDVDAVFAPVREVREAAAQVARELDLAPDWLNDAAKAFLSPHGPFTEVYTPQFPNLRVLMPTPQYLLAMKVMASRVGSIDSAGDKSDIALLIRHLGLKRPEQVLDIVELYYASSQVLPRAVYLLEEIFQEQREEL
jgi:hypothetical protein